MSEFAENEEKVKKIKKYQHISQKFYILLIENAK
jgi:hypothetical protein